MKTNILATAAGLSDQDLLARLQMLAGRERQATVELVAHLAALDSRPSLYAAQGYGSLFRYCTQALRLSEDAACNRIEAARACRRFPPILELLAAGSLSLTSLRLLARHLTPENHQAVLRKASGRSRQEIEVLLAELAPRPDVPSSVRKLPSFVATNPSAAAPATAASSAPGSPPAPAIRPSPSAFASMPRPIVQATASERYRVQFTIGQETHEKLRRLQALLRREIPNGDPGALFDRALALLLERVEKAKVWAVTKTQPRRSIRPGTDTRVLKISSSLAPHPARGQTCRVAARRGTVRLRICQRTPVLGADVPGVPPRPALCETGTGHGREYRTSLRAAQRIRGRADLRASIIRKGAALRP